MPRFRFLLRLCLSLLFAMAIANNVSAGKPILAFSVAQGRSNELVARAEPEKPIHAPGGNAAIERMIDVLKIYHTAGYPAYPVINPQNKNKDKVIYLLDRLTSRNVPFILSVIASESLPWSLCGTVVELGVDGKPLLDSNRKKIPVNEAASAHTGMPLSDDIGSNTTDPMMIQYYLTRYPKLVDQNGQGSGMVGFRMMEPEWIIQQYKNLGWGYENARARFSRFTSIAKQNGLFVQYNSIAWDNTRYPPDPDPVVVNRPNLNPADRPENLLFIPTLTRDVLAETRNTAIYLAATYPGVILTTYATNEGSNTIRLFPTKASGPLTPWRTLVTHPGVRGVGLSVQSWMTGASEPTTGKSVEWYRAEYMPYSYLVDFVNDAQNPANPAAIIQFEPNWYFFNQNGSATFSHTMIAQALKLDTSNPKSLGVSMPYEDQPRVITVTEGILHKKVWPSNAILRGGFRSFSYAGYEKVLYDTGGKLLPGQPGITHTPVYPNGNYWNPNYNSRHPVAIITPRRLFSAWPTTAELQTIPLPAAAGEPRSFQLLANDPARANGFYTFTNTSGAISISHNDSNR